MKVKFKKLASHAFTPIKAYTGDAGYDLIAVDSYKNYDYKYVEFGTGLAIEIPKGFMGLIFPRSSVSNTSHSLCNSCGVIDSGYRGEIKLRMRYDEDREDLEYSFGDKIGQLVVIPIPEVEFEEVSSLSSSDRGNGSFGSSDEQD